MLVWTATHPKNAPVQASDGRVSRTGRPDIHGPPRCWIPQDLAIEFRADGNHKRPRSAFCWNAWIGKPKKRTVCGVAFSYRPERIACEAQIPKRGC